MKVAVLLKQTPETEAKIKVAASGASIDEASLKYIVNPYDEFAVEEALKFKEKNPSVEVVVITFGPADAKERMIKALAMGADRGLLIQDDGLKQADSFVISKILAASIKQENPSIVLCGKQGIDDDNMHVPSMVAELLDWPHINVVSKIEMNQNAAKVEREVEGGQVEVYEVTYPVVLGAHKSLNTPRYASLPGIMKAKKKPLDTKTPADLGLNVQQLLSEIKTKAVHYSEPAPKPAGKIFKGEPLEAMVTKVADLLRTEAKVI